MSKADVRVEIEMNPKTVLGFAEYQARARETAVYVGRGEVRGFSYVVLGLAAEAGETANQAKKVLRDEPGAARTEARKAKILKEVGDVLWYCAAVCSELRVSLEDVAEANLAMLADRAERGVIKGSGDER